MKRTMKKLIALCLTLLMTLPLLAACASGSDDAIIIGAIGPLTGTAATYGNSVKNVFSIAVE